MSHSQYVQEEAARLIVEGRVTLLYEANRTVIFVIEEETETYRVQLNSDGMGSCTCAYWIHWGNRVCTSSRASFCYHVQEVVG